jgi:hypothetical protein
VTSDESGKDEGGRMRDEGATSLSNCELTEEIVELVVGADPNPVDRVALALSHRAVVVADSNGPGAFVSLKLL